MRAARGCDPGAIALRWIPGLVLEAMLEWQRRCGGLPSLYDWSRTHARRRGGEALRRLNQVVGCRRASGRSFGSFAAKREVPFGVSATMQGAIVAGSAGTRQSGGGSFDEPGARSPSMMISTSRGQRPMPGPASCWVVLPRPHTIVGMSSQVRSRRSLPAR